MKFKVKIVEDGTTMIPARDPWWEDYDHPAVKTTRDAFAYGKVLCEYWNSDLRPTELPRRVVIARVVGPGQKAVRKRKELPGQLALNYSKRMH